MNIQFSVWACIFLLFAGVTLSAQTPFYINYETNNGLPSSEVYSLHFTTDNKAWFTTDRGVAVYNGYEFVSFSTEDGLKTNTNFNIFEDSKNQLWFAGIDGSISLFRDGKFRHDPILDTLKQLMNNDFFYAPLENHEGQYLFFNRRSKFYDKTYIFWDPASDLIEMWDHEDIESRYLYKEHPERNLAKFGDNVFPITDGVRFEKPFIKAGTSWVGWSYSHLYKFNENGSMAQELVLDGRIDFCYIDSHEDLWVCTNLGLLYFENADLSKDHRIYFSKLNITHLKEDFEGNYWMSTGDEGVFFIPDPKINTLSFIDANSKSGRILSTAAINHRIYFGSYWGEIFSIDKNFQLDTIYNPNNESAKNLNHVYRLDSILFFRERGIIEQEDGSCILFENVKYEYKRVIKQLFDGTLFSGDATGFTMKKDNQTLLSTSNTIPDFNLRVDCVEEDINRNIWIGTHDGLYEMRPQDGFKLKKTSNTDITSSNRIKGIKNDLNENLWIATIGSGLVYKTKDSLFNITSKDGLLSNLINCVFVQDSNTVWVGTNKGLNKLSYNFYDNELHVNYIQKFGVLDGLPSNFINAIEYWNDYLWLATNEGIAYIKSESLKTNHPLISIYLENFVVNDIDRAVKNGLKLKAEENDIFLQMSGVSYRKKNTNAFYRYRLSESDNKSAWNYTSDRNIRFIDLPPGKYTFEAAAQNSSEQWSKTPILFTFEIEPFFQQTLLFKSIIAAILLSVFALLFFFRDKQLKRRNALQQNLMKAQMQANEYELVALRNQMNPHFVFNSLNAIQNYIFKNDRLKANYYLSKFSKLMRDSLEFSRLKFIGLSDEIRFLKTYLELEQMRFPETFDYRIDIDPDIPIKQYSIPSLLFQPVLENIVKHAFKEIDYKGLIEIKIEELVPAKSLSVVIQDNGSGLTGNSINENNTQDHHKSLGLTIVKNQIDALQLETEGKRASFTIVNRADLGSDESGVRVSFVIPVKSLMSDLSNIQVIHNHTN